MDSSNYPEELTLQVQRRGSKKLLSYTISNDKTKKIAFNPNNMDKTFKLILNGKKEYKITNGGHQKEENNADDLLISNNKTYGKNRNKSVNLGLLEKNMERFINNYNILKYNKLRNIGCRKFLDDYLFVEKTDFGAFLHSKYKMPIITKCHINKSYIRGKEIYHLPLIKNMPMKYFSLYQSYIGKSLHHQKNHIFVPICLRKNTIYNNENSFEKNMKLRYFYLI
jgi:hypothetical protein